MTTSDLIDRLARLNTLSDPEMSSSIYSLLPGPYSLLPTPYFGPAAFSFLALTLNQIGVPLNPNASRIWFSRKRSKAKCSLMSRSVNSTNVGGATAACVM